MPEPAGNRGTNPTQRVPFTFLRGKAKTPARRRAQPKLTKSPWLDWVDNNVNIHREVSARALLTAVLDCDPRDRVPLMERFIEALRPGQPITAFDGVMAEAAFWADMASTAERKAYALACFNRLSVADRAAFLNYVQRGTDA